MNDPNPLQMVDNTNWEEPPMYVFDTPLEFDGVNGLKFQCEYHNTTPTWVTFGESALQEMCFLWMYYYPSKGFDIRFLP
jgi:hypothetical protein